MRAFVRQPKELLAGRYFPDRCLPALSTGNHGQEHLPIGGKNAPRNVPIAPNPADLLAAGHFPERDRPVAVAGRYQRLTIGREANRTKLLMSFETVLFLA